MRRPILETASSLIRRESRHQDVPVVWLELTHNKMITFVVSLSNHIHASTGSARTVF